jgi:hypothetical protein
VAGGSHGQDHVIVRILGVIKYYAKSKSIPIDDG